MFPERYRRAGGRRRAADPVVAAGPGSEVYVRSCGGGGSGVGGLPPTRSGARSTRVLGSRQRGIGLPAAIFVITVMSSIAVAINLLVTQNSASFEEEIQLTRAFYAAESGAGFGVRALFPAQDYPTYGAVAGNCVAMSDTPRLYDFTVTGLAACRAEVSCQLETSVDDTNYYRITSEGICGDTRRTVEVLTSHNL